MKLLEHEAKDILKARGVPVPPFGGVIKTTGQRPGMKSSLKPEQLTAPFQQEVSSFE